MSAKQDNRTKTVNISNYIIRQMAMNFNCCAWKLLSFIVVAVENVRKNEIYRNHKNALNKIMHSACVLPFLQFTIPPCNSSYASGHCYHSCGHIK